MLDDKYLFISWTTNATKTSVIEYLSSTQHWFNVIITNAGWEDLVNAKNLLRAASFIALRKSSQCKMLTMHFTHINNNKKKTHKQTNNRILLFSNGFILFLVLLSGHRNSILILVVPFRHKIFNIRLHFTFVENFWVKWKLNKNKLYIGYGISFGWQNSIFRIDRSYHNILDEEKTLTHNDGAINTVFYRTTRTKNIHIYCNIHLSRWLWRHHLPLANLLNVTFTTVSHSQISDEKKKLPEIFCILLILLFIL